MRVIILGALLALLLCSDLTMARKTALIALQQDGGLAEQVAHPLAKARELSSKSSDYKADKYNEKADKYEAKGDYEKADKYREKALKYGPRDHGGKPDLCDPAYWCLMKTGYFSDSCGDSSCYFKCWIFGGGKFRCSSGKKWHSGRKRCE